MGIFDKLFKKKREEENLWTKCPECKTLLYVPDLKRNYKVCPKCDYHFPLSAPERAEFLLDDTGAERLFEDVLPADPLKFKDTKPYRERLKKAQEQTGLTEALVVVKGYMEGKKVVLASMDFGFIGGSMGSVVGERFFRACELSLREGIPLIAVTCSGGARMQEGILSLMQMAKTTLGVGMLKEKGIPYITVLANPTTGGVAASFAFLGDIIIAEPKALIGFAGPRVIEQTIKQKLPEGFQRSEFLLDKGMVDMVVSRRQMKGTLSKLLDLAYYSERCYRS
ncbi:acetyl-CoA carboxylase carboxyl transferase subunit beta [Hydrogenivirga caldilitoris]|uniref:Acetyl-coenzyme A carboxylase carboxyl transferase subunit beta n=1 Tax=Hydrogenivirga caldilitoris TaxID=246264 RepID=A0A497XNA2_9AQUI|nr:acetyl-CoA carboxylase, carboxyltransferase subunit beta [Hydrogenivirga caldilitoris]RLJ69784.1 acetyl-CoA carboxylase carboxyl transferase subunit beta [Hydrogenivirga caldilitoris]